ncbi:hypothetical protein BGZ61DRAFT_537521 [Ilyonectria robusta]|uniref:uncharacterized protein n=1 Tax=Ilyonectria robusta TaxID=1079257 RepID=UPI001E8E08E2|nr:uncharacterized protein BGZ61DRAFT_537521 [Ilyonectria robusta]KAH8669929.1 hypothetical protein BGZ61DRAFT_537521 [Ilyonectria robusta]
MSAAAYFLGVVGSKEIRAEDISLVAWTGNDRYGDRVPSEVGISASGNRWSWGFLDPSATGLTFKFLRRELEQPWSSETEFRSLVEEALAVSKYYGQTLGIIKRPDGSSPAFPAHVTKSGHDLVVYFLHGIAEAIKTDVANRYDWNVITKMPIDLMVTYPPLWPARFKHRLFQVVEQCFSRQLFPKLRDIYFVKEPEAVAAWMVVKHEQMLGCLPARKMNEEFIIFHVDDATATAIPYSVAEKPSVTGLMVVPNYTYMSHVTCGYSVVDRQFEDGILPLHLDNESMEKLRTERHSPEIAKLLHDFKDIRAWFSEDKEYIPPIIIYGLSPRIPEEESIWYDENEWDLKLSREELRSLFKPSVDAAITLLKRQIELIELRHHITTTVIMTGDMSYNPHFFREIGDFLHRAGVRPWRTDNRNEDAVQGAVLLGLGLGDSLLTSVAPVAKTFHHYGVALCEPFEPLTHEIDDQFAHPVSKRDMAAGQIKWIVEKNSPIFPDEPRVEILELSRLFSDKDFSQPNKSRIVFVACKSAIPPSRLAELTAADGTIFNLDYEPSEIPSNQRESSKLKIPGKMRQAKSVRSRVLLTASIGDEVEVGVSSGGRSLVQKKLDIIP